MSRKKARLTYLHPAYVRPGRQYQTSYPSPDHSRRMLYLRILYRRFRSVRPSRSAARL